MFSQFVGWLSDPTVKFLLLLVGGFVLKRWPAFVNKAIPVVLVVVSALTTLLHTMFPAIAPGTVLPTAFAASYMAASFGGGFFSALAVVWHNPFVQTLVPAVLAVGAQSAAKNTRQWAGFGMSLFATPAKMQAVATKEGKL